MSGSYPLSPSTPTRQDRTAALSSKTARAYKELPHAYAEVVSHNIIHFCDVPVDPYVPFLRLVVLSSCSKEYTDNKGLSEDLMKQCRLGWKAATRVACDLTSHQQVRVKKVEPLLKKLKESIKRAEEVSVHS